MASDFDKPASAVWNAADQMRSSAGKCSHKDSTNIQMNVYKVPATGTRNNCSSSKTSSQSEQNIGLAQRSVQKNPLEAAMNIQLLLNNAYYGASNLPHQIAQSPTGTVPHLGIFPSFGFSVPGYSPVPLNPISQGASLVHSLFNVEQLQRAAKLRSPRSNKTESRQQTTVQTQGLQKSAERNTQSISTRSSGGLTTTKAFSTGVASSKSNLHKSRPGTSEKSLLDAGLNVHSTTAKLHGYTLPSSTNVKNRNSSSYAMTSGRMAPVVNSRLPHLSQSMTKVRSNLNPQNASSSRRSQECKTGKQASSSKHSTTTNADQFLASNFGIQPSQLTTNNIDLASLNTYLSAALTQNANRANLLKSQGRSSMGDAEAAAILLGLRHGIANNDETLAERSGAITDTSRGDSRKRALYELGDPLSSAKRSRTLSCGPNTMQESLTTQAVDLSAKKCTYASKANLASSSKTKTSSKVLMSMPFRVKINSQRNRVGGKQFGSERVTIASKQNVDRQRYDMSVDGTVLADESSLRRHFLLGRNKNMSEGSTSVVTHLPSYICAFDCRSHFEGLPSYETEEEAYMKTQNAANNGFNFKKVICKKFTQSMSDTPDGHWEAMNECEEVFEPDGVENISLKSPLTPYKGVCLSKTNQLLSNTLNSQSSAFGSERGAVNPIIKPLDSGQRIAQSGKTNPISVSTVVGEAELNPLEKSTERAIDFRVKKRSSVERQHGHEQQIKKAVKFNEVVKPNEMTTAISKVSGVDTEPKRSESNALPKPPRITDKTATITSQTNTKIGQGQQLFSKVVTPQHIASPIPSFSDLREKSKSNFPSIAIKTRTKSQAISDNGFNSTSSRHRHSKDGKRTLPVSNLYRIRNSDLGGSNDSLDSLVAESEEQGEDSDAMSDSSYSSCESGFSRNRKGSSSSGSDDEIGRDSEGEEVDISPSSSKLSETPTRPRFVLNRPKFTLDSGKNAQITEKSSHVQENKFVSRSESFSPTQAKVKIRNPTFKFSSETQTSSSSRKSSSFSSSPQTENKNMEKTATPEPVISKNVPELKCDEGESGQSFKAMLIRALTQGNQKDGVAVDGKSLRALLGEATCFYHNNKKYVLKRGPTKARTKEGFIADVKGKNGMPVAAKEASRTQEKRGGQPLSLPSIEPRVSVTATKRKKSRKNKLKSKKEKKKMQQMNEEKLRRHKDSHCLDNKRSKNTAEGYESYVTFQQNGGKCDHGHRRHRRIHEIDNLVFEGAGGLTPIPDKSLRDSDVFTNIKLRRREAAKRGITDNADEPSPTVDLKHKKSSKTKERKKLIKTAARERAVVNKSRKHSIERKLEKYKKKNRIFLLNKKTDVCSLPRVSCVRINAGFLTPHPEVQAFAAQEIRKFRKNSIEDPDLPDSQNITELSPRETDKSNEQRSLHQSPILSKYGATKNGASPKVDRCPVEVCDAPRRKLTHQESDKTDEVTQKILHEEMSSLLRAKSNTKEVDNAPLIEYTNDAIEGSDKESDRTDEPRYPKRTTAKRKSFFESTEVLNTKAKRKTLEDDQLEISSDANYGESDSVRSESPFRLPAKSSRHRKKNVSSSQVNSTYNRTSKSKHNLDSTTSEKSNFRLLSLFPLPSAITLGPAMGDLEPSYSVKSLGFRPDPPQDRKKRKTSWNIGRNALETKQQIQREFWRNMTIDMFRNDTASSK